MKHTGVTMTNDTEHSGLERNAAIKEEHRATDEPVGRGGTVRDSTTEGRALDPSSRRVLLIGAGVLLLFVVIGYFLWPKPKTKTAVIETPPTLEARHAGEEGEKHSQEGAIEVSDETAELIGIKTAQVVNGEIEETIAATGKVLVAPNGQAMVGT